MSRPLFTSGTARGGTNLRAQILSVNKDIRLASDPYLPMFRELSYAILQKTADSQIMDEFEANPYLSDYYFSPTKLKMMKFIQEANLDVKFDQDRWPKLLETMTKRSSLASANLIPFLDLLPSSSFLGVFKNALKVIKNAYREERCKWIGFNDNWAIEFFAPLARAFPDARFMIHLRDPRGAIESALTVETNPAKIPHVISFARHWRKYVAFMLEYGNDPLFHKRLYVSTYESLVLDPEKYVKEMTDFLEVEFDPAMLDTSNFGLHTAIGKKWGGTWDIYHSSIDIWREKLPKQIIEVIEFICDPDMRLLEYCSTQYTEASGLSESALQFILMDCRDCVGWRTDFGQIEKDVGFELTRKSLISNRYLQLDRELIERCFLFKVVFDNLRKNYAA